MTRGLICDCPSFQRHFDCPHIGIVNAKLKRGEHPSFPFAVRDKFQPKRYYVVEDVLNSRAS
jgi:hypothetical protein